jgi:hypothetical protein
MSKSFFKTVSKFLGLGIFAKIVFSKKFFGLENVVALQK